jgi:CO/xanthine dehydrogenase FAD-binding subunit
MDYIAPNTLKDVLDLIDQDGFQLVTADQSLVNSSNKWTAPQRSLVSLRKVPGLADVKLDAGTLHLGASATYAEILQHEAVQQYPALAQALATIHDPHLRHNCTLGGALHYGGVVHAPVIAALMALDASAGILGRTSQDQQALQSFSQQGQRVPLASGKMVAEIIIQADHLTSSGYLALEQLAGRGPSRGIAVALRQANGRLEDLRLILAGFTEQPIRLREMEVALIGLPLTAERTAAAAASHINVLTLSLQKTNLPTGYLQHLAQVLIRRALGSYQTAS